MRFTQKNHSHTRRSKFSERFAILFACDVEAHASDQIGVINKYQSNDDRFMSARIYCVSEFRK